MFIDGSIPADAAPGTHDHSPGPLVSIADMKKGVKELISDGNNFFRYARDNDLDEALKLYKSMELFVEMEGPFDGIIGFSEGAGVGASLLAHQERMELEELSTPFAFKCGIFFSAAPPVDVDAMQKGDLQQLSAVKDGCCIKTPTAHIWDPNDSVHPGFGGALHTICLESNVEVYLHGLGHIVPGTKSEEGVKETVRAIRRTIERSRSTTSI